MGLKIYVSWWGGAFKAPPMFSLKLTFLGPKNDNTIFPHIFEDLMEGSEPKHPPLAPQKTYFFATPQKMLKFRNFQKSRFFWGPEGGVLVSKHPKLFSISIFIILGGLEAKKCHFSKILIPENSNFLSFQGP